MHVEHSKFAFADTYAGLSRHLLTHGKQRGPRGQRTLDSGMPVMFTVRDQGLFTSEYHSTHMRYLAAEFLWYLSRDLYTDFIGEHASLWKQISGRTGKAHSNYGYHMLGESFTYALDRLLQDPETRQSIIIVHNDEHHYEGNKDVPCTMHMQFQTRCDVDDMWVVDATVVMRSSDLHFGIPFDVPWFRFLHQQLVMNLRHADPDGSWQLGQTNLLTHSLHLYERHWAKHNQALQSPFSPTFMMDAPRVIDIDGTVNVVDNLPFFSYLAAHAGDRAPLPPFYKQHMELIQ